MAHWRDKAVGCGSDLRACASGRPDGAGAGGERGQQQDNFVFKANAELVLTNVVVRDSKTGEFVRGLKQSDFTVLENGKPQQISTFDFQSVDMATPLERSDDQRSGRCREWTSGSKAAVVAKPEDLRNHRLIVMFFDLTSMQPEDLDRSVEAAQDFLTQQDAAGRPGCAGFAGRYAEGGPGFYRRTRMR